MNDYADEEKQNYVGGSATKPSVAASLECATFYGTSCFGAEEYVHGGANGKLKKEFAQTGRAWKKMVGFTIQVSYNDKKWKIVKRRNNFKNLHRRLKADIEDDGKAFDIAFPEYKDSVDETEQVRAESLDACCEYLNTLATYPDVFTNRIFLEFCEVSEVTFQLGGAVIYKEGTLKRKSGGRFKQESTWKHKLCGGCCRTWAKRWFVVTDQYILLLTDSEDHDPDESMLIDKEFHVVYGKEQTEDELGITIINQHRRLELIAEDPFEWTTWLRALKTAIDFNGLQSKVMRSYDSFSPMRAENHVEFFINAHDYWNRLYDELMAAESEVFITDWWMTPGLYLRRPVNMYNGDMDYARLDNVLLTLAHKGVKVWILVWKEVEVGGMLYNSSQHVKDTLEALHPNIKVMRHPNTLVQMWSHHEKICVIDQRRAFAGGIDLCMGRYDIAEHPLKDKGDSHGTYTFPGKDYSNSRIKDFVEVEDTRKELIDRNTTPRMPWQDIHLFVRGEVAQDLAVHFIEYWNNAKVDVEGTPDNDGGYLWPVENLMDTSAGFRGKHADGTIDDLRDFDENEEFGIIGKDYAEHIVEEADNQIEVDKGAEDEDEEVLERAFHGGEEDYNSGVVEMEEEEKFNIGRNLEAYEGEKGSTMRDLTQNPTFFTRVLRTIPRRTRRGMKSKRIENENLVERMDNFIERKQKSATSAYNLKKLFKGVVRSETHETLERHKLMSDFVKTLTPEERILLKQQIRESKYQQDQRKRSGAAMDRIIGKFVKKKQGTCKCQVLRSSCNWSTGILRVEHSIMNAYIDLILNAEKFIYIENQFFMSNAGGGGILKNQITEAIKDRIIRAHQNGENFRVYIFVPLMPGFEGDITKSDSQVLKFQVKFQQETINKGPNSIFTKLRRKGINAEDYIGFYALRNHDVFDDGPKTEMIYIHSKLLIVDDRVVIIGSANINDRSMLGSRDSEVCVLVQDTEKVDSVMDGQDFQVGRAVHEFRKRLMCQHIGVEDEDEIIDCASDEFWQFIKERAETNSEIYYKIFKAEPSNHQRNFDDLLADREAMENMSVQQKFDVYEKYIDGVIGHIVQYPIHYMANESLALDALDYHHLVPKISFT
ncbi:unnamed protein product [Moneuplotes crassus]|uniref:Phospholipase n=1 Tax=Euplotes crassus TaxID=5936 RepID=A0AAD1XBW3_EUPCR|nr:unnamed protein product [Moneuplotes crassus]